MVRIDATPEGYLAFMAPYNANAIDALKYAIPATDRKWDANTKRWLVMPGHVCVLTSIARQFYGVQIQPPKLSMNTAAPPLTRLFEMRYLGRVKGRGDGEMSAYGWTGGAWNLVFSEQTLRDWFGIERRPGEALTLYNVLAVKPGASGSEIKTSWRRLIRLWHPDVSREPDAAQQFMAIQGAYEVLSDPAKRARYDAGLALERSLRGANTTFTGGGVFNTAVGNILVEQEYSPPLRCGYVMVEGQDRLGRFVVSKILEWQDITNDRGEILVTSWPEGADMFQERWVKARND